MKQKFKWGIIGTGGIANAFAHDIELIDDHKIIAVGSRTKTNAEKFSSIFPGCKAHHSYLECIKNPDVDGIYIATPHNSHHEYSILALDNNKPVLCEKPIAINFNEAEKMILKANQKNLLIMDAMWTRYLPHILLLKRLLKEKKIGAVKTLFVDHGQNLSNNLNPRLWDPNLGGGALLDLGIYVVSFAHLILGIPNTISSETMKNNDGIDLTTSIIFNYDDSQAIMNATMINNTPCEAIISGTKGYIKVYGRFYAPTKMKLRLNSGEEKIFKNHYKGHGLREQAIEFARCKNSGLIQSPLMPHSEILDVMKSMDIIREQIGLKYPNDNI